MNVLFLPSAWADLQHWTVNDPKLLAKIHDLIEDCRRHPFKGLGKPEPLRGERAGWWSRRIDAEHRLVYRARGAGDAQMIEIEFLAQEEPRGSPCVRDMRAQAALME